MAARVINLKNERPDDYVYIGRRQWCGREKLPASIWAHYYTVNCPGPMP
jgi:hypothetical protein